MFKRLGPINLQENEKNLIIRRLLEAFEKRYHEDLNIGESIFLRNYTEDQRYQIYT